MSRMLNKKSAALVTVLLLVAAGGAYAYFTQSGTGSGTAATGSGTAITVTQTSTVTALTPGSTAQALTGKFNNTNPGSVHVASVTATLGSVTGGAGGTPACTIADYAIDNPTATVNAEIPNGNAVGNWTGPTIRMIDAATNQDACKGATVNVTYTSN